MSDLYIETRLQAIKDIASASCVDIKDADNIASLCDEIYRAIPNLDKIVKELERFPLGNLGCQELNEIIEIVKHGGVSDDVCEWESVSDGEFIQNPHTNRLYSNEPSMQNVYCNTCGKKIKVVE